MISRLVLALLLLLPTTLMAAGSADEVVDQLVSSFSDLNFVTYDEILDDGFLFLFSAQDAQHYGSFLDRAAELTIIQNMFSGQVGSPSPPVHSITFDLTPLGDWETRAGPIPTQIRSYAAVINILYVDASLFVIESVQEFAALDVGEGSVDYKLIGWTEYGPLQKKGVATTWGAFKMEGSGTVVTGARSVSRFKSQF